MVDDEEVIVESKTKSDGYQIDKVYTVDDILDP